MIRSRNQMVAIIMKLKEKGILRRMFSSKVEDVIPDIGRFARTKISLAGKHIPFVMSRKVLNASWGREYFSASVIRSYLKRIPRDHVQASSLKGVYALDTHSFNRMLGGVMRRRMAPDEISALRSQIRNPFGIPDELMKNIPPTRIVGLHHRGRIFLNAEQIIKQSDIQKKTFPQYKFIPKSGVRRVTTQHVVLHEFGHHFDNPVQGLTPASKVALVKTKSTSAENPFFREVTGLDIEKASAATRVGAVESFAELYANYLEHPWILKLINRAGYNAIRSFFEK